MIKTHSTDKVTDKINLITEIPRRIDDETPPLASALKGLADIENNEAESTQLSLFEFTAEGANDVRLISLDEACKKLSISIATGRNWIKSKKLIPIRYEGGKPRFTMGEIHEILDSIKSGESNKLKGRRNKKKISGISAYRDYIEDSGYNTQIVERLALHDSSIYTERNIRIIMASFTIQLILQKRKLTYSTDSLLADFCRGQVDIGFFHTLVSELLKGIQVAKDDACALSFALGEKPIFVEGQDFLGLVYISISNAARRKALGAYYTPITVVNQLINEIKADVDLIKADIFDPCCGTGNFLIALKKHGILLANLYGQDIDEISCQIARINVALNYDIKDVNLLKSHFICGNTLEKDAITEFDIILGNPPWGYDFSNENTSYLRSNFETASVNGMESYDLFVEKSLTLLKKNGLLAFVLPEAVLNVKSHKAVRQLLLETCSFKFVNFVGNVFPGVQCPSIILGVRRDGRSSTFGCKIVSVEKSFTICEQRKLNSDCIALKLTDDEQKCIEKISNIDHGFTLKDNADFALGIVTGDNKSAVGQIQKKNSEIVLKGSDIKKYSFSGSNNFIVFTPESFQQVAAVDKYRSPEKLLYRFICDSLVFAYDNKQTLSLNSCNVLIPHVSGIDMKYILAILNSKVATFWWKKRFDSIKVLRSHIEEIPFPIPSICNYQRILKKINQILALNGEGASDLYESLDKDIMELYELSDNEQQIIYQALSKTNMFI